jgi:CRP-like cAMP-binding protein
VIGSLRLPQGADARYPHQQRYSHDHVPAIVTGSVRRLERGETLYSEGEEAPNAYLLLEGVLRVIVPTATGKPRLADFAGPGDLVATAVFEGLQHGETVVAADAVKVAQVDLGATLGRPAGRLGVGTALVTQLNRSRELADDLGLPMGARICRILARLTRRLGRECEGPADPSGKPVQWRRLPFSLTHDDVALMAGCARVTATRVLGELKARGALVGHRGDYALVPSALDEAADEYVYEAI